MIQRDSKGFIGFSQVDIGKQTEITNRWRLLYNGNATKTPLQKTMVNTLIGKVVEQNDKVDLSMVQHNVTI